MKNFYSKNKTCNLCQVKIANQNKTNICRKCYIIKFKKDKKQHIQDYYKTKYLNNKEQVIKNHRYKYQTDIQYKMRDILRSRLKHVLKGKLKSVSAVKDLGCSIEQLKTYLESLFQPGMTWDNWSRYGWHIDHIKPLSSFDLTDPEQQKKACHYTNLQPLWAAENLRKSCKIDS